MTVPQEKQMNAGVELLLKRMETHPEEFAFDPARGAGKWARLLDSFKHCLTEEERHAVEEGIRNIERTRLTELVLEGLVDPKSSNGGNDQYYQNLKNTALGGATQGGYTLTSDGTGQISWTSGGGGGGQLQQAQQAKAMLEHLEAHRAAIAAEEKQKKISMLERILGK